MYQLVWLTLTQKSVVFPRAAQAATATVVCIIVLLPLWITVRDELVNWKLIKQAPQVTIEKPKEVISSKQEDPASSSSQREQEELEYQEVKKAQRASFVSNVFNKPLEEMTYHFTSTFQH
ncbi:hypothetical protein GBA52_019445 [Prunus armeniaca]|nr:hypothetical protein GBA52_019445 [Prunus armeniaca]